jgi:hypothetical protein
MANFVNSLLEVGLFAKRPRLVFVDVRPVLLRDVQENRSGTWGLTERERVSGLQPGAVCSVQLWPPMESWHVA